MVIGALVDVNMATIEQKLKNLKKFGFNSCQLCCWDMKIFNDENARKIKALLEENEITVSTFWCGWEGEVFWNFYEGQKTLGLVPKKYRRRRVKNLCDGADFAKKLGINQVATHMGYIPENPYDKNFKPLCDAIRKVANHLKENNQTLLFETGQETPTTMLRCFETVGCDNLGINLDTANLIIYGKANPVDALDVFGEYVRDIHAKDAFYPKNGHDLGTEVRLGEGKVDFKQFFTKLKQLGYDSFITIEREIEGDEDEVSKQKNEDIIYAKTYLEDIIKEVY